MRWLLGAVLPRIQNGKVHEPAVAHAAIELHVWASGELRSAERHVFVVGLIGIRAAFEKLFPRVLVVLLRFRRAVVEELVVVPGNQPRAYRMGRLQMLVRLVLRMP